MLDHIGLSVSDYARSKAFYDQVLPTIGGACLMTVSAEETGGTYEGAGYGVGDKPSFWIGTGGNTRGSLHDAFHAAAIAAGARDNGPPGLRPHYHPDYYGAFVFDPDGHNVEAVCHRPE